MKKRLILLCITFILFIKIDLFCSELTYLEKAGSETVYLELCSIKLIEVSSECSIYELESEDGTIFYHVIAAVATHWLPETVEGFCERTIGDPEICNAVYDVTSMLVSLRGKSIYKGISRGITKAIKWIAKRDVSRSTATVEAKTYEIAGKIKKVFKLYKEACNRGKIPWESIESSSNSNFSDTYHAFYKYNKSKSGRISGTNVNFRTTPSIETYNKISQLNRGTIIQIIGYKIPENRNDYKITIRETTFIPSNNENSFRIVRGIAVKYLSNPGNGKYKVKLLLNDGSVKYGYIRASDLTSMSNKKWYKIKSRGRIGWIFEDFISY